MIDCLKNVDRIKPESPYRSATRIPETSSVYYGVGTVVVTYSNGLSQAFVLYGDDYLIVHHKHTIEWIK